MLRLIFSIYNLIINSLCNDRDKNKHITKKLIICAGAWVKSFLREKNKNIFTISRQVMYWFKVDSQFIENYQVNKLNTLCGTCQIKILYLVYQSYHWIRFPYFKKALEKNGIAFQLFTILGGDHGLDNRLDNFEMLLSKNLR